MGHAAKPRSEIGEASVPWAQRPGETDRAYGVFRDWIKKGRSRTLKDAQAIAGHKTPRVVEDWSAKHGWIARARAWDEEQDRVADEAAREEAAKLGRHVARARVELQLALVDAVTGALVDPDDPNGGRHPNVARGLLSIATGTGKDGPRVKAWLAMLEASGYEPVPPEDGSAEASRAVVADALAQIMSRLPDDRAELFRQLVAEAMGGAS